MQNRNCQKSSLERLFEGDVFWLAYAAAFAAIVVIGKLYL